MRWLLVGCKCCSLIFVRCCRRLRALRSSSMESMTTSAHSITAESWRNRFPGHGWKIGRIPGTIRWRKIRHGWLKPYFNLQIQLGIRVLGSNACVPAAPPYASFLIIEGAKRFQAARADIFDLIHVFYDRTRRHSHPGHVRPEA